MTSADYRSAIATLGLSQLAAGRWLGVSPKTAQRYASDGPSPGAAKAIQGEMENRELKRSIELIGEIAGVCVYDSIGRACSYCQCDRREITA